MGSTHHSSRLTRRTRDDYLLFKPSGCSGRTAGEDQIPVRGISFRGPRRSVFGADRI